MATDEQIAAAVAAMTAPRDAAEPEPAGGDSAPQAKPPAGEGDAPSAEQLAGDNDSVSHETPPEGSPGEPLDAQEDGETGDIDESETIDYDMLIPMPDGREPVKLGDLKDAATNFHRREAELQEREAGFMRQMDESTALLAQLGEIPEPLRQQAQQRQQDYLRREHAQMLEALPEMATREGFERVSRTVSDVAKTYGFDSREIGAVSDHRLVKLLKDFGELKARVADAGQTKPRAAKTDTPAPRRPGKANGKAAQARMIAEAAQSRDPRVKAAAAARLLNGE